MKRPELNSIRSCIPNSLIQATLKSRADSQDARRQALANFRSSMVREVTDLVVQGIQQKGSSLDHLDASGLDREVEPPKSETRIPKR